MAILWRPGQSRVPTNAAYQVLIDMEIAGPLASGWHTVADPVNHPGPFELDVDNVQIYSLPSASSPSAPTGSNPSHQHK
jgi:hypothetical protein